jgi:hypothetical protein
MSLFDSVAAFLKLSAKGRAADEALAARARTHLARAGRVFDEAEPAIHAAEEAITAARRHILAGKRLTDSEEGMAAMNGLWMDPRLTPRAQSDLEVLGHTADEKLTLVHGASDELIAAHRVIAGGPRGHAAIDEVEGEYKEAIYRQIDLADRAGDAKETILGSHEELFNPFHEPFEGYYLGP